MANKIEVEFVRGASGAIDETATLASWRDALIEYSAKESADLDTIRNAVAAVWSDNPTLKSMNLDAISSFTMNKLNVPVQAFAEVKERIQDYVRSATDVFALTKGKGGGVQLLSRLDTAERAKVDAQRTKAAEKAASATKA